jgi:hypothetical protein
MEDKYGKLCGLMNALVLVLLWAIGIIAVFLLTDNWIIRIGVSLVLLLLCAWLEERILSSCINKFVERLLKKH